MMAGQSWSTRFCCRIELTSILWSKYAIYVIVGIPKEYSLVYFLMPIVLRIKHAIKRRFHPCITGRRMYFWASKGFLQGSIVSYLEEITNSCLCCLLCV
jgi:hypothetical protein